MCPRSAAPGIQHRCFAGILQQGDMARELSFAIKGTLVVSDNKGTLVDLISGEGTSPCIVGAVSFLLGMFLYFMVIPVVIPTYSVPVERLLGSQFVSTTMKIVSFWLQACQNHSMSQQGRIQILHFWCSENHDMMESYRTTQNKATLF